jgi:hypothetical protein
MPDCPEFVIWNPVNLGWKFSATASAAASDGTPTNDYDASMHIVKPGGTATDWLKADLNPGPASIASLMAGGYGVSGRLLSGPSGPTITLHAWIDAADGTKPFDCTWTNAVAGTEDNVSITIVVKAKAS